MEISGRNSFSPAGQCNCQRTDFHETQFCWVTVSKLDIHGSVHHDRITKLTNKMQLCRIIYCSLTALHVSSDNFAHH